MFVFLSKLLPLFVYPVGLLTILILLALLFGKKERFRKWVLILALAILVLTGNKWLAYTSAKALEWQYLPLDEIPQAEAIVVLGGATMAADYPRPGVDINSAGDRVLYAADLYQQGKAPIIVASGGSITWQQEGQSTPASQMAVLLERFGVPEADIILQDRSYNTHEDAVYSCALLKERGITKIILVTSAMHMPRSVALFRHEGMEVIPAPTDYRVTQSGWDDLWKLEFPASLLNLIPSESNMSLLSNAMKEFMGMVVYRLQGWI